ncbi:MAG TPA: hypothetical protein VN213_06645 [Solirubrobacteraceae bacterium]|nr:hypothetical protein [Solirubrobacteraceae bacterium]
MAVMDLQAIPVTPPEGFASKGAYEDRHDAPGGSLLDAIRARHHQLEADDAQTELFDVPGYRGQLVARYRRLTFDEVAGLREHATTVVEYNADLLTLACEELLLCDEHGNLQRPSDDGPVRYDRQWARVLGIQLDEKDGAREVLRRTIALGDHAVNDHSGEVYRWMRTGDAPERRLLGESSARPTPSSS